MLGGAPLRIPAKALFLCTMLILTTLAGCTSLLAPPTVNPEADLIIYPMDIEEGGAVTLDARDSDATEGVITGYHWEFGDGNQTDTIYGMTSHAYARWGTYVVTVTVTNDQGGEDTASQQVQVNGAPVIDLDMPESVKAGDIAILDATGTHDPEGGPISVAWDLDWGVDSDGDGDPRNDVDSSELNILLETNASGNMTGTLSVTDDRGITSVEYWSLEVMTRRWSVSWEERTVEISWSDYLAQGESSEIVHMPGDGGRLISMQGVLKLEQDIVYPEDNFTLRLSVPLSGLYDEAQTSGGNITNNETASATIERNSMNPIPQAGEYASDSESHLLNLLLNTPGARYGQGEWTWIIIAEDSQPDPPDSNLPDPDPGNDWTLTVSVVILMPTLTEIP